MAANGLLRLVSVALFAVLACSEPQYSCSTEGASPALECECPEGEHRALRPDTSRTFCATDNPQPYTTGDAGSVQDARPSDVSPDAELDDAPDATAAMHDEEAGVGLSCLPGEESCNGRDDDCDQRVDEGMVCGGRRLSAAGSYTCYVREDGHALCWGDNKYGQLGDGFDDTSTTPVKVLTSDVVSIAAATFHTCSLSRAGVVSCWGHNDFGQLGDGGPIPTEGEPDFRAVPTMVALPELARDITVGSEHSCAALEDGSVFCWGRNEGRFGNGPGPASSTPVKVNNLPARALTVAAGYDHTCAVLETRKVACWGSGALGHLGDGTLSQKDKPVLVPRLANIVEVAADGHHTCALSEDGAVHCWGYRIRSKTTEPSPVPVALGGPAAHVAAAFDHDCVILKDGGVWCWGANQSGQLGDGSTQTSEAPIEVRGLPQVVELALGTEHSCARDVDGGVHCWGSNWRGALGDGTAMDRHTPVEVLFEP